MKQVLIWISVTTMLIGCGQSIEADLIVRNARIYTVDGQFSIAEAMAIKDGLILEVGAEHQILNKYSAAKLIDAQQAPIYPGFMDAHCHFLGYAKGLAIINLVGTTSFEEVVRKVANWKQSPSDWILGRGWDQNDWDIQAFPDNDTLNALFPDRPIALTRIDGHAMLVNRKALELAGITADTPVSGGQIMMKDGKPTGILIDNAMSLIDSVIPEPDELSILAALAQAEQNCFSVGLTSLMDAGMSVDNLNVIESAVNNGLKIKLNVMLDNSEKSLNWMVKRGIYKRKGLRVGGIKVYADGALGSRGACLLHPYHDQPGHSGFMVTPADSLHFLAKRIFEAGYQLNTHCIGDSAVRTVLEAYASVLPSPNDRRWRIEHAQVVAPSDLNLFKSHNIIPSVQPTHATSDMYWAGERLGKDRLSHAYAYRDLLSQNGLLALGTDFPVEDISPLKTFYASIARTDSSGFPKGGFLPDQKLSREEALRGMTIWAALSGFEETTKGSLEAGKSADFVILNNDIMECPENKILQTQVKLLAIDGQVVFELD